MPRRSGCTSGGRRHNRLDAKLAPPEIGSALDSPRLAQSALQTYFPFRALPPTAAMCEDPCQRAPQPAPEREERVTFDQVVTGRSVMPGMRFIKEMGRRHEHQ